MSSSKGSAGVSSAIDAARGVLVLDGASGTPFVLRPGGTTPDDSKIHSIVPLELLISIGERGAQQASSPRSADLNVDLRVITSFAFAEKEADPRA